MSPALNDEVFEGFLAGECDTLEGQDEAQAVWKVLAENAQDRHTYNKAMSALRAFEQQGSAAVKMFSDAEQDSLWSVVWAGVATDAQRRSGLSKQALRHLTIPSLVNSIVAALGNANLDNASAFREVVVEVDVPNAQEESELEVSIASLGGAVSMRVVNEGDKVDLRVGVGTDGAPTNQDIDNWQAVSAALQELSKRTTELLGADALVNCRVSIAKGKAEVHLRPLHVGEKKSGS